MKIDNKKIHLALKRIGLALNMSNNLTVTDVPEIADIKLNKNVWETDHSQEIKDLEFIEKLLRDSIKQYRPKGENIRKELKNGL